MKKIFFTITFLIFTVTLFAASSITGRVVESKSKRGIEFVSVAVYNPKTEKNISGALTNEHGVFNISALPAGKFELRISFVGFEPYTKELTIDNKNLNLGEIELVENSKVLKEVEVVGQGSQMRFDIDKKVFSVDQNIAAAGGSATDVLENIPSVDVDNDGNVSLRNNSSVEIWINGKPSGLTADNSAQVLQQMPAENLESIEIMTNPSAKYNPEGTAGIINLVMKKERKSGYYGSLTAGTMLNNGKLGKNLGASINYNIGKFDMFANIGFRQMRRDGSGFTNRKSFGESADTIFMEQNNQNAMKMVGTFGRAGIDYYLNNKNTIGINGMLHLGTPQRNTTTDYLFKNNNNEVLRDYSRENAASDKHQGYNINLSHKLEFDKKGTELVSNVIYSRNSNFGKQNYTQKDRLNTDIDQDITQQADGNSRGLELKSDFTKKFTENDRLEIGWSSRWNDRLSIADGYDNLKNAEIESYYNRFKFDDQTHALYATYGTRIDDFSIQGGLRGEYYANSSTTTPATVTQPIKNDYFKLFPSLFVSKSLPNNNELQFNYTRRINRPWGRQINSYRDYSDSTNIVYGNPDLTPVFASVMELNYLKTWDNHTLSSSIYYRFSDDVIQRISFMNEGVMESTFMNLSRRQDIGAELVAKNRFFKILNLTSSLNLYQSKLDSTTYNHPLNSNISIGLPERQSFAWNARVIANLMFSPSFSGQITGQYRSAQLQAQGEQKALYTMDLGLRKSFFNRKLNINLNVRDLLNTRRFSNISWGEGFYQESEMRRAGRTIGLTVSYNFGNMKPKPMERNHNNSERGMEGGEEGMEMDM